MSTRILQDLPGLIYSGKIARKTRLHLSSEGSSEADYSLDQEDSGKFMMVSQAKNRANTFMLVLLAGASLLLSVGASAFAAPANDPSGVGLFTDSAVQGDIERGGDPTILRTRYVDVRFDLLAGRDGSPVSQEAGSILTLNLFGDVVLTGVLEHVELNQSGGFSWLGHVEGVPLSQVTLVVKDGLLVGNVVMPAGFYQVRYVGNGVHAVYEIDPSAFPPEMEPIPADIREEAQASAGPESLADDGSVIDVLVVYTPGARAAEGGTQAMNALIDLAVAETNTSYANSLINQRLNLVHTAEVSYVEFDFVEALYAVTDPDDGLMDNVHTLRDDYAADEVVLIIHIQGSLYCGVAWFMSNVSTAFESNAFAVVHRACATGYYSFGHELGHNMGARHDWYVDNGVTPYTYSHGYVNAADQWRTILAYNSECSDRGFSCTRLQYWSNPDVTLGGDPMGVPGGTAANCSEGVPNPHCDADNRETLNQTAYTVANFRVRTRVPSTPTELSATTISKTRIDLTWTDNSNNESGFKIERSPNGTTGWMQIDTVGAGVSTYSDVGLAAGTAYFYRVRAYNQHGDSGYSNIASATTLASVVGPLVYDGHRIDDDTADNSNGDGNGRIDCGEAIELYVDLWNQGNDVATGVVASISTTDPYVTWLHNTSSDYADVPDGEARTNIDDFDLQVSSDIPHGHYIHFDLDITAANGGGWSDSFDVPVFCFGPGDPRVFLPLVLKR
jgi:hypothetical protein